MKLTHHSLLLLCLFSLTNSATAAAPVVDLNQTQTDDYYQTPAPISDPESEANQPIFSPSYPQEAPASREHLSSEMRIRLLEQQINNLMQMNLPGKMDDLQQQIQQLNGQIEVQQHHIEQLLEQQRKFYEDIDNRPGNSQLAVKPLTSQSSSNQKAISTTDIIKKSETHPPIEDSSLAKSISQSENKVTQNIQPLSTAAPAVSQSTKISGSEEKAYENAFDLLTNKQNKAAMTEFNSFIQNYPNSIYGDKAHYWLGELYLNSNQLTLALKAFTQLIKQFPNSSKISDALVKIALIHDQQGKHDLAQKELHDLIQKYPDSTAARLAKLHLTTP